MPNLSPDQAVRERRGFLRTSATAAALAALPYGCSRPDQIVTPPPEQRPVDPLSKHDRVSLGVIGAGGMANGNIGTAREWVDVVAICDIDSERAASSNAKMSDGKAKEYHDYRELLDRNDIQVIHIATPDHWHTKPLVEAMLAGKDVYCEKPLTLTIDEGKLIRRVQKETGRIVQVGTQQRSMFNLFVKAMAMVADGRLGKITQVDASIGNGYASPPLPVAKVPASLDWDRWLGPAPFAEYRYLSSEDGGLGKSNCHVNFRWWYEYSGGKLTDWGAHHVDICSWALLLNGQSEGPTGISGKVEHPVEFEDGMPTENDRYNTATKFKFTVTYPGGAEMVIRHGVRNGVMITGEKGRIFVNRSQLTGIPVEELAQNPLPEDAIRKVYKNLPMYRDGRAAHWANFLHCVRERTDPISDVHSHMKMLNICHLAGICARLNRDLQWDDAREKIIADEQANSMLSRPYRQGYEIEMG